MKLLQGQGQARGGCGKDLELPGSAAEPPAQAVPDLSPAAPGGTHTFLWPRAAVQHQRQQSRTKCLPLLQAPTKAALNIQIKTPQNQGRDGGDRPRDASAPTALLNTGARERLSCCVTALWRSSESLWAQTHPDTPRPRSAASKPLHSRGLSPPDPPKSQPPVPPHPALQGQP